MLFSEYTYSIGKANLYRQLRRHWFKAMTGGWYLGLISDGSDHRPEPEVTRLNRNSGLFDYRHTPLFFNTHF